MIREQHNGYTIEVDPRPFDEQYMAFAIKDGRVRQVFFRSTRYAAKQAAKTWIDQGGKAAA